MGITVATAWRSGKCEAARTNVRRSRAGKCATAAAAGERQRTINKTMKTETNLSLANRKQLADMLSSKDGSLRKRALQSHSDKQDLLKVQAIEEYARKEGIAEMLAEITDLEARLETQRALVNSKGLRVEDGRFDTYYGTPTSVANIIAAQIDAKIGSRADIERLFDDAQVKLMTIGTLDEARALIESLLKSESLLK